MYQVKRVFASAMQSVHVGYYDSVDSLRDFLSGVPLHLRGDLVITELLDGACKIVDIKEVI